MSEDAPLIALAFIREKGEAMLGEIADDLRAHCTSIERYDSDTAYAWAAECIEELVGEGLIEWDGELATLADSKLD